MKKFMIFLLMAFLYLGTSQASNEFTPSSSDVGKSLRHWVSPSVGSSAYAKFKPFSSLASDFESAELTDSVVRVHLVGPTHACPGQVITLTAVVENDYLGIESYEFRRNGNYLTTGVDPLYPNRISVTVPDLGGLDSLIQEYDVVITKGCHTFRSPAFYLRVNSIHVQLNDALVCSNSENGMLCADVFSNHAEAPYAYVWYNAETGAVEDTTYVPCKSFSVGKYLVEPHFTWNACVTKSDTGEVKVTGGPADNHITMDDITALACSGSQVSAQLHGIINADSLGTPSISWSLNGITIPGAHDSLLLFSPIALAGDTTIYILKAEVSYSGFACKTYSYTDTVNFITQPEITIFGNPVACGDDLTSVELYARTNGYINNPTYTWKINGTNVTYSGTLKDTLKLSAVTPPLTASSTPYQVSVSVTGDNGCSANSDPFILTLNGAPVVHLSSSADTVCNGATVTLTANLADNNIPNLTYEWYYKIGTAGTYTKDNTATSAQYTAIVTDSTSYKVVVKQTDSQCESADSISVYVYPDAPAAKPLVLNLVDTAVCNGGQITVSLIDTANTNQYGVTGTYQWFVNGIAQTGAEGTSFSFAPSIVASDSAIYSITVNAVYATTCATMVESKDTSIVLYKQPSVVISGDPIVCNDDTVRLTANIHGLYGTDKYTWRVDGVDSIMNKDFVAQLNQRDYPYNITVVVAPGTACETVSEVYSVLIGNNPTVAIGLSAATVCKDNEVTLTAHLGDYNMPNLTYQWFYKTSSMTDSVAIPTGTSRELTTVVTDTTQYFVTVTQVNSGCIAKGDTMVNVFDVAPQVKLTNLLVDQAKVCYGAQVTLTAIDTANYKLFGTGSYQWIVNGVTVANATDSIYTFAPATVDNDSINYTVKVRVDYASACAGMFSEKDTLITVHRNPSVVIAGDAIVCDGSPMNLTAVVHDTLAGGNIDYLWRVDGVDSTTGANFTATLEQRDYPYELTVVLNKGTACEVVSAPFNVLIGNKATAAVSASDTIVCLGGDVTLTAHLGDYNMPNMTYLWYSKPASATKFDSIPVGTSLGLTTTVAEETQYFVKITQVNSGCVAYSDTIKVKVFNDAAADVKPIVLHASDTAVCYGGQIVYAVIDTANIKRFGKGTYQWSVNGVTIPTATDSVFIFSPVAVDNDPTLYNVAVSVSYSSTPCNVVTASIDTIARVFGNLSVVISGDPILCQDSLVNLVATVHDTLPGHRVTYLWRVDGVDSVNQNKSTFSAVLPQRDYPYEITVVVGQEGTACGVVSNVYNVLIGINPSVAIEISSPIVCQGGEATLIAHLGDYNMPNMVYQWFYKTNSMLDSVAIPIGTSRILTVPVNDTTRYYVRVKQVNSECEAWADTIINVLTPNSSKNHPIQLLASDSTVCIGGQIAYTVQDTANRRQFFGDIAIPGNYTWFVNGFQLMTASGDHFMFSPSAFDLDSTVYIIEVSASYGTECNFLTATVADTVIAYRNPSVVINGDPMICDTSEVHLFAIVNDTLAGLNVEYLWRVDGVDSTSKTTNEFISKLPARDYPYEITVMINQGTNCEVVSEPFYLYIEDQPQVVVTFDYDTVCVGQTVTATAHLGNYNQGNLTYQWLIDDDTVARGTESTFTYTINKPAGSNTVFSVIVNQLNSACMGTGTDSVYTFANPTLDTVLVTNLQDDIYDAFQHHSYYGQPAYDVCEGASIQITAYMKDASGNRYIDTNVTYKWRRNGVVIEGVNGYTFMEQLAILDHDQYKYVYTVEIDEPKYPNCYSVPTSVVSDTVKVRRNPIVIIGGQHYVCYQGPSVNNIVLQAWVDGSVDTGAIYRWYRDGQLEDNPYHSMYGAMFTGPFAPRYGFNYVFQVEVVNGSGCSSFSEPFEVTVMAPPVVNITPYADTVCRGGEVMLVSHLDDYNVLDYELKYQWYANEISTENLIPGATEPFYNTNVDSTTNYIVDVRYLTENVNRPHCFARDTMTVNVYDRPEIDSIIMSLTEVCEGSQVRLTAVMDSVHQGVPNVPYIYEWYRNSELLPGNAATIYDAPMTVDGNEQQYTYSVKVYQNPERMMCESPIFVSSQTLTVFPNPIVAIFGDQHICYTDTITLVANIDTISNPVSTNVHYYWFESGAPIVNLNGDNATLRYYAPAQDEPYRFTVQVERDSSITGCRSYSYEYDVWVYNAPVANVTIVDTAVCEGAEVTVTAHLNQNVPEQTNLEYQWYTKTANDTAFVLVPGATELTYTTTIFETTEFQFGVVHTLSGCHDEDSKTIVVYEIPVVTEVVMSDTNVCEGSDMIITAIIDSSKGIAGYPYFYEWRRNGELLEGNTATIHDQPMTADGTTQTYVYSVIAYQTPERMACVSNITESAELTVFGDPRVAIFGDQHVCYTDTIQLVANVDTFAHPVGDLHYIWYESGNMITNLNGDNATLKYYAPAQDEPYRFTVQIERDNSEAACRMYSTEYNVWVYNAPVANVTIVDTAVCEGAEVTVTAHLNQNVPEQTNLEYQWYTKTSSDTDYVLVPGATALTYTTIVNDTTEFMFRVVHTLSGCFDTDSKTINVNRIPYVNYVSMSDTNVCEGAQVTIYADIDSTRGVPGMPYFFEWRRNGELLAANTQTISDSPMTVDGNEQTFVYSVIAYQDPTRLACYSELVESATLNVFPNPRVTISGDQHVCETDSVFLYANVDTIGRPVGTLHYTWYESGRLRDNMAYGLADSRYFSEYFYAQPEPYRFTVEVNRDDIAAGCRTYSEEFLVWVYPQPVVNITAEETEICRGGEILLRANLNNYEFNYANDSQYQWYTVDTVKTVRHIAMDSTGAYIDSVIITVEHNPIPGATTLFYRATLDSSMVFGFTATHNLSGCSDYDEIAITVNDIPVIVSVENMSGKDTLCPGGRVELHATVAGGVPGGEVYTWYRNGVQLESTGENLIDYPVAVDNDITMYIYEVVVKQTAAGCESVIDSISTDTIWVVPNPTIELSGDPIVCDTTNLNVVITANVVSYVDTNNYGYTYQWYENNAPIVDSTANSLVLSLHKPYRDYPYSFNFEVKNPYGCTVLSEPFFVYVNDNPIVHIAADDTLICENGIVTLTADMYDQNAENLVFVWYINGDSIPGAYSTTYTTTLTSTSTFTYKAYQRDSHCAAISNAVTVHVVPAPVVDSITLVSVDTAICEGHVVSLHANVSGGDNVDEYVYTWYKDNVIVEGATGADYTDYPMSVDNDLTTHIYNVTVAQSSSACFSLYDTADVVTITVRPNPRYTIYGDADVCEEPDTITNIHLVAITTDSVIGTTGDYTFTWYESGVKIDSMNTATLDINRPYRHEPYLFKLVITDNLYGCTTETEEFAVTVGQKPYVVIAVDQDSICEGGYVTLTSTLMNPTEEGIIYQWQNNVNGTWTDIEGAVAPVYVTPALTQTTDYRLHVINTFNGCEAYSINEITVTVKPTPVIDIVSVTAAVVCDGGEVTMTATAADQYTGLGDIHYQWYQNGQAIFGANQNVYTTSPLTVDGDMTTYTFGVQVTMSNSGCVSNVDTATVTVYNNPTVNITYNNGLTLCEGGVTTLTANPHHAYFTDFTYQWFLHGQPIPGATNSTYVVENLAASVNAYDYTVEITVENGTQNGCSAVAEPVYVTIVNDPTAYITINEGVNAICEGGVVTFTVNVNDGVADTYNPYTYAWYSNVAGNGVVLGTEASFTTSANDAANLYVYYVDVTSAYGCNVRVSDTLRIVEDPTVTIAVKMGEDSVVCDGGHTTLIATVEGGLGTATYQWYKNGFAIAGATGNELVTDALYVNETAAYTVSVAQSGIACTATSTQFNVAVFEAIEVALSASSEVNCVGGSVTLTATTTNGIPGDMLTYQWFRNGNPINGATGSQYVTDENLVAGHYEYKVEVSSTISGCHVAQSGTIGITVEAEPTVMISSDVIGNAICEGGNITLTANVIYATNATQHNNTYTYTWKWYEGTTLMSVQTTDPHYTLPATMAAGSYNFFVEISSNDGLGCDASSQSNLFNVVIKPVPTVILTANADESCQGGDVTFNAVVIPSNLSGIYYWTVNGGTPIVTSNASITVNNMTVGTNNVSVVFAPNDAQVACNSATTTITHVVNAIPVVTVAATDPSRLSMCVGGTITIAATATGTANSSDRYVWTVDGQTQTGNTGSTFTTQLNTPGIHTFSAMVERAMGCNSDFSTPIAVTVAEQPTAQLTQTAGFTEMCAGGEITLMAKVPNYATVNNGVTNNSVHGTYTYTWFRDNAEFLTTPNVTVDNAQVTETLNVPAAYTYSVTISASGYNCQAAHATLDHQIRVVPDPSWSVNQVNPTELCIGGIVTLNAEVTGGVENQQAGRIQWYKTFNGVESEVAGLGGQNTDVPEAAGVYTYAPKYIDYIGAGCNIADATPTQVTVNDLPTARFTAGHGSVICGHDYQSFATLEITLTGTAPFTFTIMNMTTGESQTIVTSLSVYTYNVNPAVTSIYRIISVSDANGCIGTMDNVSDAVVSVSDVQIAAETVVASCEDWIARIPLQVNASTSTTFTATLPDGSQQTGNIMFDAYTQQHYVEVQMPAVAGDYIVTIEVDGCSGEVLVRVPASDASMGVTSTLVDQRWDDVVVVNNNPDNNGGYKFSTYQWYKNGEPINGATGQYYQEVGGLEGFYSVELDGIRVSDGAQVHFITCEKYFSAGSSIRVYPVPANTTQEVTIELNMTEEELEGAILDIYDVRGAHVKSLNNLTPITKVGNFGAQGTYFGRIITGTNEIKTVKFIIVK